MWWFSSLLNIYVLFFKIWLEWINIVFVLVNVNVCMGRICFYLMKWVINDMYFGIIFVKNRVCDVSLSLIFLVFIM